MVAEVPLHQTFNLELWLEVWRICNENQCSVLFASVLCSTQVELKECRSHHTSTPIDIKRLAEVD